MGDDDAVGLSSMVVDEVSEQVSVGDLLGEGSIDEKVEADEIGASVGGEFGARIGRELGEEIGREVHEALSEGVESGASKGELTSELKVAIGKALRNAIGDVEDRESLVSRLREIAQEGSLGERVSESTPDVIDGGEEDDGESTRDGEAEEDAEDEEEAEETTEDEPTEEETPADEDEDEGRDEAEAKEGENIEAADLEGLRRETLEDFLEVMSYRDLQSVAKDVGVKANLSRGEMTDEIVETVTSGESSGEDEDSEGEHSENSADEAAGSDEGEA